MTATLSRKDLLSKSITPMAAGSGWHPSGTSEVLHAATAVPPWGIDYDYPEHSEDPRWWVDTNAF